MFPVNEVLGGTVGYIERNSGVFPAEPQKGAVVSSPVLLRWRAAGPGTHGQTHAVCHHSGTARTRRDQSRSFTARGWVSRVLTSQQPALGLYYNWAPGRGQEKVGHGIQGLDLW